MEIFAAQCRFLMWSADPMLDGLDDSHLTLEPVEGNKSAGWIIGHLCISGDFGLRLCGRAPISPKECRGLFSPGTTASGVVTETYPRMADLVSAFKAIYKELPSALASADAAVLDVPNPFELVRARFPVVREFVAYLVTGHLAYHMGQLGDWRRSAGLGHKGYL